ncbi:hypothetical protein GCM10017750_59280 [Streptomyces racemochromogenes]
MGQPIEVPPGSLDVVLPLPVSEQRPAAGQEPPDPPPVIEQPPRPRNDGGFFMPRSHHGRDLDPRGDQTR